MFQSMAIFCLFVCLKKSELGHCKEIAQLNSMTDGNLVEDSFVKEFTRDTAVPKDVQGWEGGNKTEKLHGNVRGSDRLGVWDRHVHAATFETDNQQEPTVQDRELCLILCNNLTGKGI